MTRGYFRLFIKCSVGLVFLFEQGPAQENKLRKAVAAEDYAVALPWAAVPGLVWTTMNYGRVFNGRAETDFYWPLRTHSGDGQHAGTSSIIFAAENNVIESFSQSLSAPQDWMPRDGSLQREGNVTTGTHFGKTPVGGSDGTYWRCAHSDLATGTWPRRVDPSDGKAKPWWVGILPEGFTEADRFKTDAPWAVSDVETWFVFDDKYNIAKSALGIEIEEQIYNYGRAYAADFSFVHMIIRNTSDSTIHNAYFGYKFFLKDDIGGLNDDYLVAMNSGWNPDPTKPDLFYVYDPQREVIQAGHVPAVAGIAILKTPKGNDGKELGITDFHFFEQPGPLLDEGMWAIISSNPNSPNLPGDKSQYFHDTGPDNRIDKTSWIPQNKPQGLWWSFFAMSGPFDLGPGQTDTVSWGPIAGYDATHLLSNVKTMHEMARNGYRGPSPPSQPNFTAVDAAEKRVTLTWDTRAERHPEFEGYKIYRRDVSSIIGANWGKEILNAEGKVVGYLPIVQLDKNNGIKGTDPLNSYFWLGNDTGIRHTFVDSNVVTGVSYQYAITAYTRGNSSKQLPALENALGGGLAGAFTQSRPNGTVLGHAPPGAIKIAPADSFWIEVEVIGPQRITGNRYEVSFSDWTVAGGDSLYQQGYTLKDVTLDSVLLENQPLTDASGDNTFVIDGMRIKFAGRPLTGQLESVWNKDSPIKDGVKWAYWELILQSAAQGIDFEFVIDTGNPSPLPAYPGFGTATYTVPVRVFNVRTKSEITQYLSVVDFAARYPGDPNYGQPPGAWSLAPGGPCWNPKVDSLGTTWADFIVGRDTTGGNQLFSLRTIHPPDATAPKHVDRLFIGTMKPFPRNAVYEFTTTKSYVDPSKIDLSKIRAVPNPYYVKARWDTEALSRTIRFMYLPEECDIYIFTVSGDLVRHLKHRQDFIPPPNSDLPGPFTSFSRAGVGFHDWELVSDNEIEVAYGIYVYVVTTPDGRKTTGKLAVIR